MIADEPAASLAGSVGLVADFMVFGVLFDMDGTLVDSSRAVEAAWAGFGERYGLEVSTILAFSHGRQTFDTVTHFLPDLSESERRRIAEELVADETSRSDGLVEVPGAAAFVRRLQDAGVPMALVTSAPRDLALHRMVLAGVPVPAAVVTSEDVEHGKPSPDGYQRGAALLGLATVDCLAFEDAPAGLRAAIDSGASVIVVGGHDSPITDRLARIARYDDLTVERAGDRFRISVVGA